MEKSPYKVTINWKGEIKIFQLRAFSRAAALREAVRLLARELEVSGRSVRNYIMEEDTSRWEVM